MQQLSELELELLLMFYTFSDQHGNVDMRTVVPQAKSQFGVILPHNKPITLLQKHIDALMSATGVLPDTRQLVLDLKNPSHPLKKKKKRK